jgi:hypothetical protein
VVLLVAYPISYGPFLILSFGISSLFHRTLPRLLHASIGRIVAGLAGTFCAFAVSLVLVRKGGMADWTAFLLALGLPYKYAQWYLSRMVRASVLGPYSG